MRHPLISRFVTPSSQLLLPQENISPRPFTVAARSSPGSHSFLGPPTDHHVQRRLETLRNHRMAAHPAPQLRPGRAPHRHARLRRPCLKGSNVISFSLLRSESNSLNSEFVMGLPPVNSSLPCDCQCPTTVDGIPKIPTCTFNKIFSKTPSPSPHLSLFFFLLLPPFPPLPPPWLLAA